jgi:hypothetical protein
MSGLIDFIRRALSESDGTPSSLRPPFWMHEGVLALCLILIVGYTIWSHFHDRANAFNPVPVGSVLAGWFTINRGSKLAQKGLEPEIQSGPGTQPSPQ